jgi:quinohemoprotein ethanol dehydrogenase
MLAPAARCAALRPASICRPAAARRPGGRRPCVAAPPLAVVLMLALAVALGGTLGVANLAVAGAPAAVDAARLAATGPAAVDAARLKAAASEPQNWYTGGRDLQGSYFSPLTTINAANVKDLGFAWQYDLGTPLRGQEATPVVVDGIMYTSGTWGYVYAVDAATGREVWRYDPKSDFFAGRNPCCDLVNRGVAVWEGKVYVASGDGRLHAIDAGTGGKIWEADTITDHKLPYASTGAPQIAGDVVVIGNAGADMGHGGVRGYVGAYDLKTGALKWRFYTVPPAVGRPLENPELAAAAKTWDPSRDPMFKLGGTAWDGFAYDPDLNLVYFGTANAAPYDLRQLGPARLDSLYTASIIALHADSGRLAWYYQTTPRDSWDFDAVQKMILTDLEVGGTTHPVILQANKNGFFYVLDRKTGKLLSAKNYTFINWATGVDLRTGRPVTTANSDWYSSPKNVYPSWSGAHTWNPMSLSAQTRLVYIPVLDVPAVWVDMAHNGGDVKFLDGFFTANGIFPDDTYDAAGLKSLYGPLPDLQDLKATRKPKLVRELIRAWDPVAQKTIWEHETSSGIRGYDGGVISTAGNLVFQGRGSGGLWVYAADSGKVLKVVPTGSHIMAAPTTYAVNGVQYVAVQVGYGGTAIAEGALPPSSAARKYENTNRIIAFKLGGGPVPSPPARATIAFEQPPAQSAGADHIRAGEIKFIEECSRCHVLGLSSTPDLRRLNAGLHAQFKDIVLHGLLAPAGMERFDDILSETDVENIHAYLIDQSWAAYRAQEAAAAK